MPARRSVALTAATAALLLAAAPAHATGGPENRGTGGGSASAVVLRTGLDVSLLNRTAAVPLNVSLNEVQAPASAGKTALSATLDGVDRGRPFNVVRAQVATARATVDEHQSEGYVNLVRAQVHVPGLPLLGLIKVQAVTSEATCEAGSRPTAESHVLGDVVVLGKKVTLTSGGTTNVTVPGVGQVRLDLSKTETTSRTAAATALELNVVINPLKLNVAKVVGRVTLAEATCQSPKPEDHSSSGGDTAGAGTGGDSGSGSSGGSAGSSAGSTAGGSGGSGSASGSGTSGASAGGASASGAPASGVKGKTGQDLAETGASSSTPFLAAGAGALVLAGAGVLYAARRRKSAANSRG
jgi:LPXTG-motif cell wall-anchored protein